ncbi:MAG: hypothetical protein IJZ94_01415 [Clostridia bacterium]|nr:hypothetical protein [Clostridia bacterium]
MAEILKDRTLLNDEHILFLENEYIKLGVNIGLGGSVTYLSEHGKPNLINSFDWGRQIQMSFYSGPIPFEPEGQVVREEWKTLGWNPIQVGDCYNHPSTVLEYKVSDNEVYVKSIPMQWPMDNVPGECTFETWYSLEGKKVKVRARLNNNRADKTQYKGRHQELPAVYTNGVWYKLVSYIGNEPCTGDAITEICNKENKRGWPWVGFKATEGWAALVDDDGYGLGVYNNDTCDWIGGFAAADVSQMGTGGEKDFPTGYISPLCCEIIDHNIVYDYDYVLIIGDVDSIRDYAVSRIKEERIKKYAFDKTRQHFSYVNITDAGYPPKGCLEFDFAPDKVVIGPTQFHDGRKIDHILVDAELDQDGILCLNLMCYDGQFHEERHFQYPFNVNGFNAKAGRHTYELPIDCDAGVIAFMLHFGSTGHLKLYSIEFVEKE